jgi:hypothetical protein
MLIVLVLAAAMSREITHAPVTAAAVTVDTAAIERAAAIYAQQNLLPSLPKGRIAFDSRPSDGRARSAEQSTELARILGAESNRRDAVISCPTGPGSCRMGDYTGLVQLGVLSATDSTAEVTVTLRWPSGNARVPVALQEPTLLFKQVNGAWEFVRVVSMRSN